MKHVPLRFAFGVVAYSVLIIAAAALLNAESRWLQTTGGALIAVGIGCWVVLGILDARRMERHVEQNPELLSNDAIGEQVTAIAAFECRDGTAHGVVLLNGEQWRARCVAGPAPEPGERLRVCGRAGLTLEVRPVSGQ